MRQISWAAGVLVAMAALASCSNDEPSAPKAAKPTTSAPEPESQPDSEYSIIPAEGAERLEAGRWALKNTDGPAPMVVFDVPKGFSMGEAFLNNGKAGIAYWLVERVFEDPCAAYNVPPKLVGPTVEDLATALAAQKLTTTNTPVPVSVDGHDGLYMELTTPTDFDYEGCELDVGFYIWKTVQKQIGWRYIDEPGVDRYWILDVDGQRVVLDAYAPAGAEKESVELVSDMVANATFVDQR
jgi:hypothetical protein